MNICGVVSVGPPSSFCGLALAEVPWTVSLTCSTGNIEFEGTMTEHGGKWDETVGGLKKGVGKAIGSTSLQEKGEVQQQAGKAKQDQQRAERGKQETFTREEAPVLQETPLREGIPLREGNTFPSREEPQVVREVDRVRETITEPLLVKETVVTEPGIRTKAQVKEDEAAEEKTKTDNSATIF
ncbi:hypothetical protein QOT17_002630 [Balamuthia mandrillaris]